MNIEIRDALPEDLPILLHCEQQIVEAERPFNPTLKPGEIHYYDLQEMITNPLMKVAVGIVENEIVATGYCKTKKSLPYCSPALYAYIGFIYVAPAHRGNGFSKQIIDYLCVWAREQGHTEIRLTVYADNMHALKAYEKMGFEQLLVEMRIK